MTPRPKPITLTQVDELDYEFEQAPAPFVVVGEIPGTGGGDGPEITPQAAPVIDTEPEDADAVAADLVSVVAALVAAGVFTDD